MIGCATRPVLIVATGLGFATRPVEAILYKWSDSEWPPSMLACTRQIEHVVVVVDFLYCLYAHS